MGKEGNRIIILLVLVTLMISALVLWIISDERSKELNNLKSREKDMLHEASLNYSSGGFYEYSYELDPPKEKDIIAINLRLEEIALEINNKEFSVKLCYYASIACVVSAALFLFVVLCTIPILDLVVKHYPHLENRVPSCTFLRIFLGRFQRESESTDAEIAQVIRVGYGPESAPESVVHRRVHDKDEDDDDEETSAIHVISADLPGVPSTSSNLEG